ncbi:MAG: hypothetical protein Q8R25_03695 [bacterium]|nr:hypothetical protein [bacterium]
MIKSGGYKEFFDFGVGEREKSWLRLKGLLANSFWRCGDRMAELRLQWCRAAKNFSIALSDGRVRRCGRCLRMNTCLTPSSGNRIQRCISQIGFRGEGEWAYLCERNGALYLPPLAERVVVEKLFISTLCEKFRESEARRVNDWVSAFLKRRLDKVEPPFFIHMVFRRRILENDLMIRQTRMF